MTPHIMLDCETLGVTNDPLILSIGAVKFTETEIIDRFHVAIDPETAQLFGLKISASTVMWWMREELHDARKALLGHELHDLPSALRGFAQWLETPVGVWGNGAAADNVWVRNAYKAIGEDCPWDFRADRCYRTIKALFPDPALRPADEDVAHDALSDAVWQAKHLQNIMAHVAYDANAGLTPVALA